MRLRTYVFTLKHDGGNINIETKAPNLIQAIGLIETGEGCPESAIENIKIHIEK